MHARVTEIQGEGEFSASVIVSERPVLVVFSADWCAPCVWLVPYVDEILREGDGRIAAVKVDVDRHPELAERYRVTSVPTVVHVVEGQERGRSLGIEPDRLRQMVTAPE